MQTMHTVGQLIRKSTPWLESKGVDSPRLDAELLLAHVLGCERLQLYLDWDKPLKELEISAYRELIRERGQDRVPVARLTGKKEFFKHEFLVTPAVFVPRPETEGVVERALALLASDPALQVDRPTVFEVGTGSGCIIVSLAAENATPQYIATDVSAEALETARKNAEKNQAAARIEFRHGSGFAGYSGPIHLIVSNPPYIPTAQIPDLPPEVRLHDPRPALDGGQDGLDAVRELLADARNLLIPGGWTLLELGEDQEESSQQLFTEAGYFSEYRMERDLAGRPRYVMARR